MTRLPSDCNSSQGARQLAYRATPASGGLFQQIPESDGVAFGSSPSLLCQISYPRVIKNSPGLRTCTILHCKTSAWPLIFCRPKLNPVLSKFRVRLRDRHDRRLWLCGGAWSIGGRVNRRSTFDSCTWQDRTWLTWQSRLFV